MGPKQAIQAALKEFPDCTYADWDNGLTLIFEPTIVVKLWRTEECYLHDDPPKYTKSYPRNVNPQIVEKLNRTMIERGFAKLV